MVRLPEGISLVDSNAFLKINGFQAISYFSEHGFHNLLGFDQYSTRTVLYAKAKRVQISI